MTPGPTSAPAYRSRIADRELVRRLAASGAVVVEGPRVCGKTTTARRAAASEVLMDADPSVRPTMAVDPRLLLEGPAPRLIDEWQAGPDIWNYVRRAVDDRPGLGHFILTGSAVPPDDLTRHTGAGRMGRLRLRTMSLFELRHATGRVFLNRILGGGGARAAPRQRPASCGPGRADLRRRLARALPTEVRGSGTSGQPRLPGRSPSGGRPTRGRDRQGSGEGRPVSPGACVEHGYLRVRRDNREGRSRHGPFADGRDGAFVPRGPRTPHGGGAPAALGPAPAYRRVGSHDSSFEACSAFTARSGPRGR